ncbi:hypothetical protein JK364_27305 [Streptomyces sp. 110]|uniref:Uncharacterized protein n=1 Tax=Streptomyces endocoffeicus TaxID=2898945 RepID=A0ABS1PUV7_9ACTN|nr:hypothetical protein [Streptomyces endocoffeicus]MBL1116084.1 hypothetical protein [Streptomyces endocoffeicus]
MAAYHWTQLADFITRDILPPRSEDPAVTPQSRLGQVLEAEKDQPVIPFCIRNLPHPQRDPRRAELIEVSPVHAGEHGGHHE